MLEERSLPHPAELCPLTPQGSTDGSRAERKKARQIRHVGAPSDKSGQSDDEWATDVKKKWSDRTRITHPVQKTFALGPLVSEVSSSLSPREMMERRAHPGHLV